MSGSIGLLVGLFICAYSLTRPLRFRSENTLNDWKFTEDEHIINIISSDRMRHDIATFHNLPLLTFLHIFSKFE